MKIGPNYPELLSQLNFGSSVYFDQGMRHRSAAVVCWKTTKVKPLQLGNYESTGTRVIQNAYSYWLLLLNFLRLIFISGWTDTRLTRSAENRRLRVSCIGSFSTFECLACLAMGRMGVFLVGFGALIHTQFFYKKHDLEMMLAVA